MPARPGFPPRQPGCMTATGANSARWRRATRDRVLLWTVRQVEGARSVELGANKYLGTFEWPGEPTFLQG